MQIGFNIYEREAEILLDGFKETGEILVSLEMEKPRQ